MRGARRPRPPPPSRLLCGNTFCCRFKCAEIFVCLSKVYDGAARDPAVFFATLPALQNGVRPAVPVADCGPAAGRPGPPRSPRPVLL